jgi:hypothetical protein
MVSIVTQLNRIHDGRNAPKSVTTEDCFASFTRAYVGRDKAESLNNVEKLQIREMFNAHVNRLHIEVAHIYRAEQEKESEQP